ncbi:MAG: GNAT family N-acetyltransferase [Lachnospiraceae bacterium]|nr:GNAT family N-acetyltransferase [Lachnospiraceae bacterium]
MFYKPGDRDAWIDIEKSAREFINYEQGMVSYERDKSGDGWLHWVAVRREYQGKGLAKPLISYVLNVMRELGYRHAKIPTQTTTWLACKIYLDLGFMPLPKNTVNSRNGWRIMKALTNHPALIDFDPAKMDEILSEY